ncbi:MAG: hypothetical protein H8E27_07180 [Verrucomicrobia subdivision 3 bacterium]|nr:hypothetical protein [Limisphaerales bacterium]
MTRALFILVFSALWSTADAQPFRRPQPVTSVTKQFSAIWKLDRAPRPIVSGKNGIPAVVRVNAHSLIFFAEETKKHLLRELGVSDLWNGHVMLRIINLPPGTKPVLERQAFGDQWRYQLTVPEELPSRQLLHAMVSLLIEEYAGRYSRKTPRIPPWLTEGFTEILTQKNGPALFASLTLNRANNLFQPDALRRSRVVIQNTPQVSYLNLSLPPAELQLGEGLMRYRAHAHLFTAHLLARTDGARRMQFFIRETNRRANSQHAFLAAFDFKTMLAAEQWWSLTQTRFRNRDAQNRWMPNVAQGHLSNLLSVEAAREDGRKSVPLREYLQTGTHANHVKVLLPLVQKLILVEINAPPQLTRITREYRLVLQQYIGKPHQPNGPIPTLTTEAHAARRKVAMQSLTLLDTILADLKRAPNRPSNALSKILRRP